MIPGTALPPSTGAANALAAAFVDDAVFELRGDYRALLIVVEGLPGGEGDQLSEDLVERAERHARALLQDEQVETLPHIAQWREAYRAFGAKPQRTRNSLEALTRRAPQGLPRINRLTDVYNAISVLHQVPIGGESLADYQGPARAVRATGDEPFETVADGGPVVDYPKPGEVVWRDDAGVTCRIWNWRQCQRTQLTTGTSDALFILDGLSALGVPGLLAAGHDLVEQLATIQPGVRAASRLLGPDV